MSGNIYGKKWTDDEEAQLLEEIAQNHTDSEIGEKHGRSANAILIRRKVLATKLVAKGKSKDEACELCGIDMGDLDEQQNIENEKLPKGTEYDLKKDSELLNRLESIEKRLQELEEKGRLTD